MGVYCLKLGHELLLAKNIEFIIVDFKMIQYRCGIEQAYISQYIVIQNEHTFFENLFKINFKFKNIYLYCVQLHTVTYTPQ